MDEPTHTPREIVRVDSLSKSFAAHAVVRDISLSVPRGQILGLLGPNGAGKSTFLHLLLGLTRPSSGSIRIFGQDLHKSRRSILSRVNFSSAYTSLPTNLSVWENLNIFAKLYGVPHPQKRVRELLELFEIPHALHSLTGALSSGQLTRVNLCKAFLNEPEILFLDEPTASLDPDIASRVRRTLLRIHGERGITMIYTSHDMQEVQRMCQRVIILSQGRIIRDGSPREIVDKGGAASLEDIFISIAHADQNETKKESS
ncbi:MAG: ABC transporter ATP-binding protein [Desulfohalobiaceae bacterium]|nr:ABC transporter ATP-binding protein [Desulfohalobiaceae bacterium]